MSAHHVLSALTVALAGWFGPAPDLAPRAADRPPERSAPPEAAHVPYRTPTDAPVVDVFRPPVTAYGPGNRGLDYATVPGSPVRAVGDGVVTFAGQIAFAWYVTVQHPDGLRSSLSFLSSVTVTTGEQVRRGAVVGTASSRVQLGFRRGDRYLDPALLLPSANARRHARLVPPRVSPVGTPHR